MSCEERFASIGRRIDDLFYWIGSKRKPQIRVGPSIGERLSDRVASAQDWAASQKDRFSGDRMEQMDPRTKSAVMVMSAMIAGGAVVAMVLYFMQPRGGSLTAEEIRILDKMKGSGATNMFATPPPPPQTDASAAPSLGTAPRTTPPGGG